MKARKLIARLLLASVVAAAGAALAIFLLASRIPPDYRPKSLSPSQQEEHVNTFQSLGFDFLNKGGEGKPYVWIITAEQANLCLASVDAIVTFMHEKPAEPMAKLTQAGFSEPAMAMHDGVLTLMVRAREYQKIVSVDLAFDPDEDDNVRMRILGARIGVMPMPKGMVDEKVDKLRSKLVSLLDQAEGAGQKRFGPVRADDVAKFLSAAVGMLDGEAVRPELAWKSGARHRVLIKRVELAEGELRLHVEPLGEESPSDASSRAAGDPG